MNDWRTLPLNFQIFVTIMWRPTSCDTFVVLPPATANNYIIFGKNSDRPNDEVQEVVYIPPADNAPGKKIQVGTMGISKEVLIFAKK